jgi:hypothetical protein
MNMSIKIVSVRDGFKDEDGIWREKWQVVSVSEHFAQALIARERTIFSTASLKDQIAKGLPQITVRNFCRALGLSLEGDMSDWRERAIAALVKLEAAEDARIAALAKLAAEDAAAPAGEDEEKEKDQAADHDPAEGSSAPPATDHAAEGDVPSDDDEPSEAPPAEDAAASAEKPAKKSRKAK